MKSKYIFIKYLPLSIGLIVSLSLHFARTYIDYQDTGWALKINTPQLSQTSGYFHRLHEQILDRPIFLDTDCYYWVMYAAEMAEEGKWRIRRTEYDNVPYGRDVAWHSGYSWFLVGLGFVDKLFTGREFTSSIEHSASWANPLIVAVFTILWSVVLAKKINPFIGCAFSFLILFSWSIQISAVFAKPDHHVLHNMLFLSHLLSILVGGSGFVEQMSAGYPIWPQNRKMYLSIPSEQEARKWFIAAGIFGGMGLWVGATQQAVLIASIGLGALSTFGIFRKKLQYELYMRRVRLFPEVWRWWGVSGALSSLVFYFIEYFPNHMGMRLEVNHPLYALAWLGGSEIIYRITSLLENKKSPRGKRSHLFGLIISCLLVAILPFCVFFGPDGWHTIHDLTMRRMHHNIVEFFPPFSSRASTTPKSLILDFSLLPLLLVLGCMFIFWRKLKIYNRIIICMILVSSLVVLCFYLLQLRWNSLFTISLVVLGIFLSSTFGDAFSGSKGIAFTTLLLLLLLIVPGNIILYDVFYTGNREKRINNRLMPLNNALLAREVAINLFERTSVAEVRIIGNSSFSPYLAYYKVGKCVSSLYWPNRDGVRDYARFFADLGQAQALAIARARGLTHMLFKINDQGIARRSAWVAYGTDNQEIVKRTFAYRLAERPTSPPAWLTPFPLFYSPRSQLTGNVIYKIGSSD